MEREQDLFSRGRQVIPGGVCAAHRVNRFLGRPFYVSRGEGSRLVDLQGREYLDLNMSFGATLLGHGHPAVREALRQAADLGILCALETEYQVAAAEEIAAAVPCVDMVRFTMTGTEATWYAIKLAREYTGRDKVVKFEGHFHGWNDYLQYNFWPAAGRVLPVVKPDHGGTPRVLDDLIVVLPFNDEEKLEETLSARHAEIAAVILEPINYNSGGLLPTPLFLERLRALTRRFGIVLIFDEILSGFRTGPDCAQGYLGVTPDLCTLGKAIGCGMPLSVFGGRRDIMEHVAPLGRAMHSGTYNAHLSGTLACLAFFDEIRREGFYPRLLGRCDRLYRGLDDLFRRHGVPARVNGVGARFGLFFGPVARQPLLDYQVAMTTDHVLADRFYEACLRHGVYFHPGWHHGISAAHTDRDVDETLQRVDRALEDLAANRA